MTVTIVKTRAVTGGVDTHADAHVAAALDPIGGLLGVQEFPATTAGVCPAAGLAGQVRASVPGRDRRNRKLWCRPRPAHGSRGCPGGRGRPLRPARPAPGGQVRSPRCGERGAGCAVGPGPWRAERPGRRGGGDPGADGRQAQRPRRADPDDQPGQVADPDRARGPAGPVRRTRRDRPGRRDRRTAPAARRRGGLCHPVRAAGAGTAC